MDALTATRPPRADLPPEAPLQLAPGRLAAPALDRRGAEPSLALRRVVLFLATAALTAAGVREMYDVVDIGGVTVLEWALLAFFALLFAWVAFSFLVAVAGFLVTLSGGGAGLAIGEVSELTTRTALLAPTYNEDPHHVTARLRAMWEAVEATGQGDAFAWFLLSDTTDPDVWIEEEAAFRALQRAGLRNVHYRHRANNHARKSGNIADWIARFGGGFDHMIVLDADSLMSGETIVRLAGAMEASPNAGLIQTAPLVVNARSLFGRLQQFAGRLYGPMIVAGSAWWQGPDGNYWGHNAIIRLAAFAEDASLPELKGRKPFGGHILSHDFIEAAFLRRAGWAVYAAPDLPGSYEEGPPSLIDFAARDRRWCQGNLQHLAVLPARGLRWPSRLHLMVGIGSYLTAPMWFAFLALGLLISLQAAFVRPEYFPKGFALFPAWPEQDPVLAAWVFAGTMSLLILPKIMAWVTIAVSPAARAQFGGVLRPLAGLLLESLVAALIAPAMMVFQSRAVSEILIGRDAGWPVQRRDDGAVPKAEVARKLIAPTLVGLAMAVAAYSISVPLLLWMSPVIIGLFAAIPVGVWTSTRWRSPGVLATPEDRAPPPVVARAAALSASARAESGDALERLRADPDLAARHLAAQTARGVRPGGRIDAALATARMKVEHCGRFKEARDWLDKRETRALLSDAELTERVLALP